MRLQHRIALVLSAVVVAAGFVAVGPAATASAATTAPANGRYTAVDTTRVWSGTIGTTPEVVQIAGHAGVPADATAVVVNVEVEKPTAAGYVRVTPAGADSSVATQEFAAGQSISNLATVKLSANGSVQVKVSQGSATGYFDVSGYYSDGSGDATYTPLDATRVFQQTVGTSAVTVPLAGRGGVPADATAVVVNTEVGNPTAAGYVRVTPAGKDAVVAAQVFGAGQTISNLVIVKLDGGAAQVKLSRGSGTVYMDVSGYYSASDTGSVYVPMDTTRAYAGAVSTTTRTVRLAGTAGVPGTATAVVANAEVGAPTSAGYLRVTPAGQDATVATQVFSARHDVSNLVMSKVTGSTVDRRVQAKLSAGSGQLFLDVAGYFVDGSSGTGFGADISHPQCTTSSSWPDDAAFGIVGVNDNLANKTNPCLAQQLDWANGTVGGTSQPLAQLYVLAANPGSAASVWPASNQYPAGSDVPNPFGTCTGKIDQACSYMYGYARAYDDANSRGVTSPGAHRWWIDAETNGVSWRTAAEAKDWSVQNRADLEGMVAALRAAGVSQSNIGLYSTKLQFAEIVGTSVPAKSTLTGLPSWIAVGTDGVAAAQRACTSGGLTTGSQVLMAQWVNAAQTQDFDVSCV